MKLMNLKAKSKNFFIKLALVILLGTFALGGVSNLFFTADDYVVKIGKEKFSPREFNEFKAQEIKAIEAQVGKEGLNSLNLDSINDIILSKFIDQKLIAKLADDLNITVNDHLLKWWVVNSGFFADKDKKFNKEKYAELLRLRKVSEKEFLSSITDYLKRKTIVDVINSLNLENKLLKHEEEIHRNLEANFILMKIKDTPDDFVVTPEEVVEFYKQNKEEFLQPETRDITYLTLSVDEVMKNIEVSDKEALTEYNNNLEKSFNLLEFESELEAKKYLAERKSSAENLSKAVKAVELKNEALTVLQARAAATLSKENDYSLPYLSEGKWYILQVIYQGKNIPTFAEVRKEIKENIIKTQARGFLSNKENELKSSDLLQTLTLEEIAQNYGWKIGKITNICKSCAKTNAEYQKLTEKFTSIPEIVFDNNVGQNSELEESYEYDGSLVVRVDKIKDASYLAIEDVTPEIKVKLKKQKLNDFLIKKSEEFKMHFKDKETNINSIQEWLKANNITIGFEQEITSKRFKYITKAENLLNEKTLKAVFTSKPHYANWDYNNEIDAHIIIFVNKFYENKEAQESKQQDLPRDKAYEELMIYLSKYYDVKVANFATQENK